jgi:hypothetical protein
MGRRLVPLRIPAGWTVVVNSFAEIADPRSLTDAERQALLAQDLLQLRAGDLILDLGWTPEDDASGRYRLELVRGDWDDTLLRVEHPSAEFMRNAVDICLGELARDADPASLQHLLDEAVGRG